MSKTKTKAFLAAAAAFIALAAVALAQDTVKVRDINAILMPAAGPQVSVFKEHGWWRQSLLVMSHYTAPDLATRHCARAGSGRPRCAPSASTPVASTAPLVRAPGQAKAVDQIADNPVRLALGGASAKRNSVSAITYGSPQRVYIRD